MTRAPGYNVANVNDNARGGVFYSVLAVFVVIFTCVAEGKASDRAKSPVALPRLSTCALCDASVAAAFIERTNNFICPVAAPGGHVEPEPLVAGLATSHPAVGARYVIDAVCCEER